MPITSRQQLTIIDKLHRRQSHVIRRTRIPTVWSRSTYKQCCSAVKWMDGWLRHFQHTC